MSMNNEVGSMKKKFLYPLFLHFLKSRNDAQYLSLYSRLQRTDERKDGKDERVYKRGTEKGGKQNAEIKN
jgi:hypothetical protein